MRRQFVFFMTDTTRFDMLGCYGNPAMKTPNLDRMAADGVRFARAYTTQPVCGPARSALFTGLFPHSNGSWGNCMPLGADVQTLGQRLSADGVHCGYIGKWHLDGGDYFGNGICPDGWDAKYWYDMKMYLDELSPEERLASRNRNTCLKDGGIDPSFTFAHRISARAIRFLEEHRDDDFFLVVSYDEPHDPYLAPPPYNMMYADYALPKTPAHFDTLEGKPEYQKIWADGAQCADREAITPTNPLLFGCNSFADAEIGKVLSSVDRYAPGAMRLYTSDHGDAIDAHCLYAKGPAVYDEIARVPLIMSGPRVPEGRVYPHTVSHIDIPAMIMDYMGLPIPVMFEGESLLSQVLGGDSPTGRDAFVEFSRYEIDHDGFGGFQPMRAVVTDRYKLALHMTDTDELYDELDDPYDVINRIDAPEYRSIRNDLHDRILDWMNRTRDPFRGYQWKCRPWREEYTPTWAVDGYTRQREPDPGEYRQLDYLTGLPMTDSVRKK